MQCYKTVFYHVASMRNLVPSALFLIVTLFTAFPTEADAGAQKAVLITGASSGIGRKIAERLAADGYLVYAGVRKESDLKAMNGIYNIRGVLLDVTSPTEISEAVSFISGEGHGLYALVNNAGLVSSGNVTAVETREFDQLIAVNVAGPFRMVQAFAPLIIAGKGRIVNIGSTMGTYAVPNMSVYCMTKFAIEAFTESLDQEMAPLGVKVSVIEPGTYRSEIGRNALRRQGIKITETTLPQSSELKQPDDVAAAAEKALFEPNPKRRYLVVPDEHQHESVVKAQIEELVELNEGQAYTYDRATLVKMLDERLSHSRTRTP